VTTGNTNGRGRAKGFQQLIAWQKAYELVLGVYRASQRFPADERFGLTQQMRRAAVSIPANVAEGWGRGSRTDYVRFLDMARGSAYELQTQLWIASDLGYLDKEHDVLTALDEVERLLNGLIRSLRVQTANCLQPPRP